MIETRLLYYFLAVAREQNITKAAEELHIAQPSLSKQMYDLENKLGKKLLIRGNKNTTLTEEGEYFRSKAEEIIELLEKTEMSFEGDAAISGKLSIGCAETSKIQFFTSIIKKMATKNPKIFFNIYSGNANDVLEKLDKGLIDVGILINPDFYDKYEYIEMPFHDSFGILAKKDSELAQKEYVTIDKLRNVPLFISAQRANNDYITNQIIKNNQNYNIVGSYNLIFNATYIVEQGLGYAICLEDLVDPNGNRDLCYIPFSPEIIGKIYVVTKKHQIKAPALKLFLENIDKEIKSNY